MNALPPLKILSAAQKGISTTSVNGRMHTVFFQLCAFFSLARLAFFIFACFFQLCAFFSFARLAFFSFARFFQLCAFLAVHSPLYAQTLPCHVVQLDAFHLDGREHRRDLQHSNRSRGRFVGSRAQHSAHSVGPSITVMCESGPR